MKNLFKNLMLVAVAAMAFTACTENNDEVNATKRDAILKFSTSFAETRVTIGNEKNEDGEYPVTWDGDEDVRFDIQDGGWWTNLESEMFVDSEDARNATFEVILSGYAENASADAGSTIYAYFGKLDGSRNAYISGQTQTPQVGGVDKSFISMVAEFPVEVEGQMDFNGTFNHKTAYGLITLPSSVEDVEFKSLSVKVNNEKEYLLNVDGLDTHSYWFACEPGAVSSIIISAIDSNDAVYGYTATGLNKTFTKGRVAKFSIKSLETDAAEPVELGAPNVTATVNGTLATLSWEAVENASGYAVSVMGADYENIGEATEYTVDLSNYPPFSYVYVYVKAVGVDLFLDSQDATVSVMAPVTKDSDGDSGFDFTYDSAELRGTDKYKFYNSAESKEYMYLYFDRDITTLEPGSYTYKLGSGVNGGTADSAYRHPVYTNGSYVEWWFQGEFVAFVDVTADSVYSITVFCKRGVENGEYLFKGYWSGKLPKAKLETPQNLNATVSDSTINVTWSAVANATGYEVSFNGETNTTTETSYSFADVEPGDYTIEVVAKADNFDTSAVASVNVTVKAPAAAALSFGEAYVDPDNASYANEFDQYIIFNGGDLGKLFLNLYDADVEILTVDGALKARDYILTLDNRLGVYGGEYNGNTVVEIEMTVSWVNGEYHIVFKNACGYNDVVFFENATYTGAIEGLALPSGNSGGDEPVNPEPVEDSFEYLGRSKELDTDPSTSGGDYVYEVVAGGVQYILGIYYPYVEDDGAIKYGTYNYVYNALDQMYSGWDGFVIAYTDKFYYGSTLTADENGVALHLVDANGNLIGDYTFPDAPTASGNTGGDSGDGGGSGDGGDSGDSGAADGDGSENNPYVFTQCTIVGGPAMNLSGAKDGASMHIELWGTDFGAYNGQTLAMGSGPFYTSGNKYTINGTSHSIDGSSACVCSFTKISDYHVDLLFKVMVGGNETYYLLSYKN